MTTTPPPTPDSRLPTRPKGVSVVIVSYNVRELLDACLQSLRHAAAAFGGPVEIIVFDNDSRDGTVSLLKPRWPGVTWIASDRNLGFGTGCNRGAAVATHDMLLFLNPDTLVREDTLAVMRDFFAGRDDVGIAGCKIVNRDGSLQAASKRGFPSPRVAAYKFLGLGNLFPKSRVFGRYNLTYLDENETHEVDAVSGSFMCVRTETFRAVGGFDEDFFMYGEDLDLCFRIKALGLRNYYHPATQVVHFKGESAKSRPLRSFLSFYEAMILFSRKHLELRALPGLLLTVGVVILGTANFVSSRFQKWPRWLADLALVNAFLAVVTYAYHRAFEYEYIVETLPRLYLLWHLLASLSFVLPFAYIGDYGRGRRVATPRATLAAAGAGFLIFFSLGFFMQTHAFSRIVFAVTAVASALSMTWWRWATRRGGAVARRILGGSKRVAVLGTGTRAQALAAQLQAGSPEGYECVGFIQVPGDAVPPAMRAGVIGDLDGLEMLARKLDLQGIVIALEEDAYRTALGVLARRGSRVLEVMMLVGDPVPGATALVDLHLSR